MASTRFLTSGIVLYLISRRRGAQVPPRIHWRNAAIAGGFLLVGGNGAVVWAEQTIPSGLTALLVAILPFWLVLLDWARPGGRRPGTAVMLGLVIGLGGIFILVGPSATSGDGTSVNRMGAGVLILASLSWALGSLYSRHADLPASGLMRTGLEMITGGAALGILGVMTGEPRGFDIHAVSLPSILGLLYLVTFGSLVGFTSYIWLLDKVSPARIGTYAYVNPVVAVLLGWAIAGERLTSRTLVAAAIVICAVAVITTARSTPAGAAREI